MWKEEIDRIGLSFGALVSSCFSSKQGERWVWEVQIDRIALSFGASSLFSRQEVSFVRNEELGLDWVSCCEVVLHDFCSLMNIEAIEK